MINIQNFEDNECFKWCLIRNLNPADYHSAAIRKVKKVFERKFDFKDIKSSVKIRDIYKVERKNYIGISIFGYGNKIKYPL